MTAIEASAYLRLIDFVYHATLGLRVIKKHLLEAAVGHDRHVHPEEAHARPAHLLVEKESESE